MSVEALAVVLHHSKAKGTDKLVLLGIANHAGDGGSWPAVATLARYANVTERSAQRSIQHLVNLGEVSLSLQAGGPGSLRDDRRPNRYDVLVACPATCDGTASHRERRLPQAQSDLWITGVTPMSPRTPRGDTGDAHGVTPTSPEPSLEPSKLSTGSQSVTGSRASGDTPTCTECSAPDLDTCVARQAKLRPADRHTYSPWRRP